MFVHSNLSTDVLRRVTRGNLKMFNVGKLVQIADSSRAIYRRCIITTDIHKQRTVNGDGINTGKLISVYFQYLGVNFVYHNDLDAIQYIDSETLVIIFDDGTIDDVNFNCPQHVKDTIDQLIGSLKV